MNYFPHSAGRTRNGEPGWRKLPTDDIAILSPIYGIIAHADVGTDNQASYDQILRFEKPGSVFLPVAKARAERSGLARNGKLWLSSSFVDVFGLQKVMRPQAADEVEFNSQVEALFLEATERFNGDEAALTESVSRRLQQICELLGRESLEIPRGFAKPEQSAEMRAIDEVMQSTGNSVRLIRPLGRMNDNNAQTPHMTEVFYGEIDRTADPNQDGRLDSRQKKTIAGLQWMTRRELDEAIGEGRIYDGYTLSALQMYEVAARAEHRKADPEQYKESIINESGRQ